jgi:ubiquinone/menaquinone biosynthesis C-methylase UbiE
LSDELWFNLLLKPDSIKIPSFPSEEIQTRFTGVSNLSTMRQAFEFYKIIQKACAKFNHPIPSMGAILDFGCGWGRIIRIFMRDIDPAKLYGIDCINEMIDLCKETNPWCNFSVNDPQPPTQLEANSFDLIYAYSVFSHLSENTSASWIKEFHRILKPGGVSILTTRKRNFIANLANPPYPPGLNIDQAYKDYDNHKFVFFGTGGGYNLDSDFYGEAFISKNYVEKEWGRYCQMVDFIETADYVDQNIIVLLKKPLPASD